jgi:cytochrome c oxidase subunit 2
MDHLWLPENVSTFGSDVDWLFYLILVITGIAFVGTQALLVWFLVKYRARPGQKATYIHGSHAVELVWTVIPALILVMIALIQGGTWTDIKSGFPPDAEAVRVQLFAKQFEWRFAYPGADARFGTADDVYAANLRVPVGRKVLIEARSQDVLHSLFLPHFRVKQDIVPGMNVRIWFEGTKTGRWEIACAELCGLGHYRMRAFVEVLEPAEHEQWHLATSQEAIPFHEEALRDRKRLEERMAEATEPAELAEARDGIRRLALQNWAWEWGRQPALKVEPAAAGHGK